MIYVLEIINVELNEFMLIQLKTSCCSEKLIIQKMKDGSFFNVTKQEDCNMYWKEQIERALKQYESSL